MKAISTKFSLVLGALGCVSYSLAQPTLSIPEVNSACASGPIMVNGAPETVGGAPDAEGYVSLFDGTSLKGWWESCKTPHSSPDNTNGGVFMADPANGAIYTQQKSDGSGGVLMTNQTYGNYEIMFDYFGTYGDDGGVFNRTTATGKCYQTVVDYLSGSSIGGAFAENGYGSFNVDTYVFGANKSTINNVTNWTKYTALQHPENFGCPATGCTAANWTTIWDINGWNQVRVKFYGGLTSASKVKMQSFIRRISNPPVAGPNNWVPVYSDSQSIVTPASYIGFQIHTGTGRWVRGPGTWYKNIKIRTLDENGAPVGVGIQSKSKLGYGKIDATRDALVGSLAVDYEIVVSDAKGRILESFHGKAGDINHLFSTKIHGAMVVEIKSAKGIDHLSITRL
jgi:hypothetical protein